MKKLSILVLTFLFILTISASFWADKSFAQSFNPAFGITLSDNTAGANSNIIITATQPAGDDFFDKVTFRIPAGFDINSGTSIADGATVATGTIDLVYGAPLSINFTFLNIADTAGYKARWSFNLPSPLCCLVINVNGSQATGHSLTINPILSGLSTPLATSITLLGTVGGVPNFTNPTTVGNYTWQADFVAPDGTTVTRSQTLSIPGITTPTGNNVTVELGDATIAFDSVTEAGTTAIATSQTPPPEGSGQFELDGIYYDFDSTATFSCPCTITLPYDPATTPNPRIYHMEAGVWTDVTTSVDTVNNTVTGTVSSFSFFGVGEPNFGLEFLNPVSALLQISDPMQVQNNMTLPVNFALTDSGGNFIARDDVAVQIINNSTNILIGEIPAEALRKHYKANLNLKELNLPSGTYKIRVKVGNTTYSPTLLFNPVNP